MVATLHLLSNANDVEIQPIQWGDFFTSTHSFFGIPFYNFITLLLIFVGISFIYNRVFRARKLPVLKEAVVYAMILIGSFFLLVFQLDANLPIVYSLSVAIGLIFIYQLRVWNEQRKSK
jgi:uncharacterized membrane protein